MSKSVQHNGELLFELSQKLGDNLQIGGFTAIVGGAALALHSLRK